MRFTWRMAGRVGLAWALTGGIDFYHIDWRFKLEQQSYEYPSRLTVASHDSPQWITQTSRGDRRLIAFPAMSPSLPSNVWLTVFWSVRADCGDPVIANLQHVRRDWVPGFIVFPQNNATKATQEIAMVLREDIDEVACGRHNEDRPAVNG